MPTNDEPTYVTEMRRRHRALDTAVLNAVRERGPVTASGLRAMLGQHSYETLSASLYRLRGAGRVSSQAAPPPNERWLQWRAVERAVRE